jgi:hypothetical protein
MDVWTMGDAIKEVVWTYGHYAFKGRFICTNFHFLHLVPIALIFQSKGLFTLVTKGRDK